MMKFLKKLFTKKTNRNKQFISVPNYSSDKSIDRFIIEKEPDIASIFNATEPTVLFPPTKESIAKWADMSPKEKKDIVGIAYLAHPNSGYRLQAIETFETYPTDDIFQLGIDLLADDDERVAYASAKVLWRQELIKMVVKVLRDEIQGHSQSFPGTVTTANLRLGQEKAILALDRMVTAAPNETFKDDIQKLIDKEIIIESRTKKVATDAVEFVGTTNQQSAHGENFTYEVYRATTKAEAEVFLSGKQVSKKLYYIEVETPEGTWGKDIDGMYKV